jgi:hypothetical protein
MEDSFEIPVMYQGEELEFTSKLLLQGYTFKILVDVNGNEVMFEPDEERNFRAMINPETTDHSKSFDVELLKAIANALENLLRRT